MTQAHGPSLSVWFKSGDREGRCSRLGLAIRQTQAIHTF